MTSVLLSLLAGCFSFEASPIGVGTAEGLQLHGAAGKPAEHVVVANYGWYLFNLWPLATGNASVNARCPCRFFRNDVHEDILMNRLSRYAADKSLDIGEMNIFNDEQVLLSIPGISIPIPLPYVLTFHEMQISSVLVKPVQGAKELTPAQRRKAISREMRKLLGEIPDGGSK